MAMYTRCPACKSEIAFEPPANIAGLPEDYKHRIKCPSCGVTIGVKLNTIERQPVREDYSALQPVQQAPYSYNYQEPASTLTNQRNNRNKKDGTMNLVKHGQGRNAVMMIFSLLFIALGVVGYLISRGTIRLENSFGLATFDGISFFKLLVKESDAVKLTFEASIPLGILSLLPTILFVLAIVDFLVSLIALIGGRYSRAFNIIWSLLLLALGVVIIFSGLLSFNLALADDGVKMSISEYFEMLLVAGKGYAIFAGAAVGLLQTIFSLVFLSPYKYEK